MGGNNMETRSIIDELRTFDNTGGLFDFGHPLLNRVAESFVKAAGIGAAQAVSWEAYFTAIESASGDNGGMPRELGGSKRSRFPNLKGGSNDAEDLRLHDNHSSLLVFCLMIMIQP